METANLKWRAKEATKVIVEALKAEAAAVCEEGRDEQPAGEGRRQAKKEFSASAAPPIGLRQSKGAASARSFNKDV